MGSATAQKIETTKGTGDGLPEAARGAIVDLCAKFDKAYFPLLNKAERMSETTSTAAWQEMYAGRRRVFSGFRLGVADALDTLSAGIRRSALVPDDIKRGKELFKAYEENQDEEASFNRNTVEGFQSAAEKCSACIEAIVSEAQRAERDNALQFRGVASAVGAHVKTHPAVKWDADAGQIVIG